MDSRRSAAPRRLPQITTTDVVPSPASTSWAPAKLTSIFAVGCITDMLLSMVCPSLVMIVSPFPLRIILSMPRGPREVRTASATANIQSQQARFNIGSKGLAIIVPLAATMLDDRTAIGFSLSYKTLVGVIWRGASTAALRTLKVAFWDTPLATADSDMIRDIGLCQASRKKVLL